MNGLLNTKRRGNMTPMYIVKIEFFVRADDDDDALNKVTKTLKYVNSYDWSWEGTQLLTKGDIHVNPNK
jgi:thioester reductase-like protein